nr:hypothetical protein [Tanacetum cinerariifolium]
MTTLAEFIIIVGAENRPPMLEKSMYDSWKSQDGTTRTKKYEELLVAEKLQADCDLKAINIVLQGLSLDMYDIVNHHKVSKEIWDRGETLYQYYWRFSQLINNMNVINMSMRPVEVNTKFLNSLPSKWSKFVMDVKLARDFHTTNYDQLYSYLEQHEPKRPRNATWFKKKEMLAETHKFGQILDEEQLEFHTEDVDAYDSDCDDLSNTKVVLIANLSNYGSEVILE